MSAKSRGVFHTLKCSWALYSPGLLISFVFCGCTTPAKSVKLSSPTYVAINPKEEPFTYRSSNQGSNTSLTVIKSCDNNTLDKAGLVRQLVRGFTDVKIGQSDDFEWQGKIFSVTPLEVSINQEHLSIVDVLVLVNGCSLDAVLWTGDKTAPEIHQEEIAELLLTHS